MYNNEISNILKYKIELGKYNEAIQILEKEILEIYISKIKEIDNDFQYTTLINLMDKAQYVLNQHYNIQLKKYFYIINDQCSEEYEVYILMKIYRKIKEVNR